MTLLPPHRWGILALAAWVLGFSGTLLAGGARSPRGDLVFSSVRDGDSEIVRMDLYSKELYPLTENGFADVDPVWASGGEEILFCSNRGGRFELYSMRADGSRVRRLFRHRGHVRRPAVSPDGLWIALTVIDQGHTGEGLGEVYIINRFTLRVVAKTGSGWNSDHAVFNRSGSAILFTSDRDGPSICRISINREGIPSEKETLIEGQDKNLASPQVAAGGPLLFYLSHGTVHEAALDLWKGKVLRSLPHRPRGVSHEKLAGLPGPGRVKDIAVGPSGDRVYVVDLKGQYDLYYLPWGENRFYRLTRDPADDMSPSLK